MKLINETQQITRCHHVPRNLLKTSNLKYDHVVCCVIIVTHLLLGHNYFFCYNGIFLIMLRLRFSWYVKIKYRNNVAIMLQFCSLFYTK